jgi:hypothetical protein
MGGCRNLFRHQLFRGLLQAQRINKRTIERMLAWQHYSGFNVHRGAELDAEDAEGRRRVARYLLHPPVAVERMEYDAPRRVVVYHIRQGAVETVPALEWVARVASHIPNIGTPNWCGTWGRTRTRRGGRPGRGTSNRRLRVRSQNPALLAGSARPGPDCWLRSGGSCDLSAVSGFDADHRLHPGG